MIRILVITLTVIWAILIIITAVNMYNHYLISKQNMKVLKIYQVMTSLSPISKTALDSLSMEIAKAESLSVALNKPFPLKDAKQNWLMLRIAIIVMSILTGSLLWLHYRKSSSG